MADYAAGIGSMNFYYQRSDEDNNPIANPASTDNDSDPGEGWSNLNFLDFNAGYVRYDVNNNVAPAPQPYQRHDENNNPIATPPYVRYDEDNIIVPNPPPIPNSP